MKAIRFHEYGGPEVLRYEDVDRPEPGPGEVLVRVHAAGVNPVDWHIRAGNMKAFRPYPLPFIPGWEFSGVVESAGPDAGGWKPGERSWSTPPLGASAVSPSSSRKSEERTRSALPPGAIRTSCVSWEWV